MNQRHSSLVVGPSRPLLGDSMGVRRVLRRVIAGLGFVRLGLLRTAVVALGLASLWGCGEDFVTEGACAANADCPAGLVCHDARVCVSPSDKAHPVVLRLAPPPGQRMVLEHFDAAVGGDGANAGNTWQLTSPAAVRGTVVRALDTFNSSIPGTLIATAPGKIPGTTIRYDTTSHSTPRAFPGSETLAGFELLLQIGPTYGLTFWPDSAKIPPYYTALKVGGDTENWALKLPAEQDLLTITGRLVHRLTAAPSCKGGKAEPCTNCAPIVGLRVMLVDGQDRVRSSREVTDATGAFELRADPGGGPVRLRFEPAKGEGSLPHGVLRTQLDLPTLRKKGQQALALGDLDLGPKQPATARRFKLVDPAGKPVTGATVKISTSLPDPGGCDDTKASGTSQKPRFSALQLKTSQPSNDKGEVVVNLPAGVARVEVIPPAGEPVGRRVKEGVVLTDAPIRITCPDRASLRGSVTDFRTREVSGAQLQFVALDDNRNTVTVSTDAEGRFIVPLDVGRWAVIVEPPRDSGLGRYSRHTLQIEAGQEPLPLDVTLPPPSVMVGRVLDRAGNPLSDVLVDVMATKLTAFEQVGQGHRPGKSRALLLMATHLLATTVTGVDGRFEVLVETSQISE